MIDQHWLIDWLFDWLVGWLKTVDQYYMGLNKEIDSSVVQYILHSVINELEKNPDRKFMLVHQSHFIINQSIKKQIDQSMSRSNHQSLVAYMICQCSHVAIMHVCSFLDWLTDRYVEQAFFQRYWDQQDEDRRNLIRKLVKNGQFEFVNGGWCMVSQQTSIFYLALDIIIDQLSFFISVLSIYSMNMPNLPNLPLCVGSFTDCVVRLISCTCLFVVCFIVCCCLIVWLIAWWGSNSLDWYDWSNNFGSSFYSWWVWCYSKRHLADRSIWPFVSVTAQLCHFFVNWLFACLIVWLTACSCDMLSHIVFHCFF